MLAFIRSHVKAIGLILAAVALFLLLLRFGTHPQPEGQGSPPETLQPYTAIDPSVRFVALGDMGSGSQQQKELALEIARYHRENPFSFVLLLGDLIYPDGNVARYGQERFTEPYQPLLNQRVRFWAALGNHDILGSYRADVIRFFDMPASYYDFTVGNAHFYALDTNDFDRKQAEWLADRLSKSQETWNIVFGHHPVYSSGEHGSSPSLIRDLKPILERHRADLYLAGHDHNYERFVSKNGVTCIISGGGGAEIRRFQKPPVPGSQIRASRYHFMSFEIQGNNLHFKAIDQEGALIDSGRLMKSNGAMQKPAA